MNDPLLSVLMLAVGLGIGLVGIQLLVAVGVLLYGDIMGRLEAKHRPRNRRISSEPTQSTRSPVDPGVVLGAIGEEVLSQPTAPRPAAAPSTPEAAPHIAPARGETLPDPAYFLKDLLNEGSPSVAEDYSIDSPDEEDDLLLSGYRRSEYHKYGATDEDIDFWGLDQPGAPAPEERRWAVWDQADEMDRDAGGLINGTADAPYDLSDR